MHVAVLPRSQINSRRQTDRRAVYAGSRLKLIDASGGSRLIRQPFSRNGENSPYGMLGGIVETSASFEARSAPRSYPTTALGDRFWPRPCENSTRYNRTRNFGLCGDVEGKKTEKICLPLGITTKSDFVFTRPRPLTTRRTLVATVASGEQRTFAAEARGPHSARLTPS